MLNASAASAAGIVFAEPLRAAAPPPTEVTSALVEAARKEGKVSFYTALELTTAERLSRTFEAKYPGIAVRVERSGAERIFQRIAQEQGSGIHAVDVANSTDPAHYLDWKKHGWLAPYVPDDVAKHFPADQIDPDGMHATSCAWTEAIGYNTNLVKVGEQPKSFQDFIDPKWKGKIAWSSTVIGAMLFITGVRNFMGEEKALAYLRELAKQDIAPIASANRVVVDRVMAGEYALCLDSFLHHPIISARKGAPVAPLPLDPVLTVVSSVMLPKAPPHPHAAVLFIDYLLSKDGQEKLQGADYFPAHPAVPASADLDKIVPQKIALHENFISPAKMNADLARSRSIYQELFAK